MFDRASIDVLLHQYSLILRWDNAPHHPHIGNFPYHLHREKEDAIEESSEMTLSSVLNFIKKIIQK
ncbi:MAG TPA: DUF6516 family protein [Leptospiraceae bacterium]|nr:DUF6516 family protein [Leptospiraceae bacterium]HRG75919.1 DUF6516 family protein [Leptospiraceae bacterium]